MKKEEKKPTVEIRYVITCKIWYEPKKKFMLQYYTGQENYGNVRLTGWNIYKKYAHVFTDQNEAWLTVGKLKKLIGSEKAKVKIFEPFSKN